MRRMRRAYGPPAILPQPLCTSGRRWQRLGLLRTTLINQAILLGHHLGVPPQTLARLYKRSYY